MLDFLNLKMSDKNQTMNRIIIRDTNMKYRIQQHLRGENFAVFAVVHSTANVFL